MSFIPLARLARRALACASLVVTLAAAASSDAREPGATFAAWSASPVPVDESTLGSLERDALARCGRGEAGLRDVARSLLARKLQPDGGSLPELDGLAREQRAAGEPHPWPRAWSIRGRSLETPAGLTSALSKLDAWLGPAAVPQRRCGVASGLSADGTRTLVVLEVEALADLAPLPTRARTGQWLTLEAHLRVAARSATVIAIDAGGAPRNVPSWIEGNVVRARFAPERPGELDLQVVADVAGGPRPVLEATVFVDVEPSSSEDVPAAPGEREQRSDALGADDEHLTRMIAAARAAVALPALPRDPRLDRIALEHARQMARTRELAHDAGDGDPLDRLRAAGLDPHAAGENVAHAATLPLAHRALWASPSHRLNLLGRAFDRMGVGVVRDEQGALWVVETFAGGL